MIKICSGWHWTNPTYWYGLTQMINLNFGNARTWLIQGLNNLAQLITIPVASNDAEYVSFNFFMDWILKICFGWWKEEKKFNIFLPYSLLFVWYWEQKMYQFLSNSCYISFYFVFKDKLNKRIYNSVFHHMEMEKIRIYFGIIF